MDGALPWLPTASYLEVSWTLASLFGLLVGLHRLAVRVRQWRLAALDPDSTPLERIVSQVNLRHKALVTLVMVIAVRLGLVALQVPADTSLGMNGAFSVLGIVVLLLVDLLVDEVDAARLKRARGREG